MKTTNILNGINSRLDIAEEKISEFEALLQKLSKKTTKKEKKKSIIPVSCWTTSSSQINI